MTAPLLVTRDALVKVLAAVYVDHPMWTNKGAVWTCRCGASLGRFNDPVTSKPIDPLPLWHVHVAEVQADALLTSGVVRDPATLAADEALVIRTMQGSLCQLRKHQVQSALRALDAALTEDPSREGCAVIADGSKRTLTPLACKGSISGVTEDPS